MSLLGMLLLRLEPSKDLILGYQLIIHFPKIPRRMPHSCGVMEEDKERKRIGVFILPSRDLQLWI